MNYDYEAIDNRKIRYSDDIYFLNYNENFELWLNREKVKSFDTLRDVNNWLFQTYVNLIDSLFSFPNLQKIKRIRTCYSSSSF